MKRTIKYMLAGAVMIFATSITAQSLRSAYFLDGFVYRHEMNPAFMGERNYVAIPILGQLNIGAQSNVGLSNFIYKYNDPLHVYTATTFMHPSVSADQFLGNLHEKNRVNTSVSLPIISFGFHKWGGFNTFGINLRINQNANLPYGLFDFMKTGQVNGERTVYNFKDLSVRANAYAEVAFGHSRVIDDKLTVGGKFKFLIGGANADAKITNMDLVLSEDMWSVNMEGRGDLSLQGASLKTKNRNVNRTDGTIENRRKIDGLDWAFNGFSGYGMGIDLGATYKMDDFVEGLTLSAALLDLGFISWNHTVKGYNDGITPFEFDGFHNIQVKDDGINENGSTSLDDQMDDLSDDLEDMFQFYDGGVAAKRTTALNATLNIGAQYVFPYYKNLSFGFLLSNHFNKPFTWTEGRFYANVAPVKWFDASINYGASTYGSSFGWILNFHPKGFNFFIGSDHMIFKVNPQFVPIHNLNANVSLGFNITFGCGPRKCAFAKK